MKVRQIKTEQAVYPTIPPAGLGLRSLIYCYKKAKNSLAFWVNTLTITGNVSAIDKFVNPAVFANCTHLPNTSFLFGSKSLKSLIATAIRQSPVVGYRAFSLLSHLLGVRQMSTISDANVKKM